MIEIRRLCYFLAVAEAGGFREAADRLGMTQPPLSHQIMELEKQLGERVFVRLPRSVELTEVGRLLKAEATPIVAMASGLIERVRKSSGVHQGVLRIGVTSATAANSLVASTLRAYRQEAPLIDIRLHQDETARLCEAVAEGEVDLAFVRFRVNTHDRFIVRRLLDEPMLLAVPRNHRLSTAPDVAMDDLAQESFVIIERSHAPVLHDAILTACEAAGISAKIAHQAPQKMAALMLVAGGAGITFVPASMEGVLSDLIVMKSIRSGEPSASLVMLSRNPEKTATRKMGDVARRIASLFSHHGNNGSGTTSD
ncbi:Ben and cat operon transcriptional regulator [Agrobacterium sp. DSM 25558]|uniref:LysR family transcriptional regulator n=1 Tax=Agrobacterium sp. DSM 25558 TaxID=1907665 RepID=UPI00097260BD|nr:LysR family transcriptional regulator [Agrobacterium sp. DSM 25558]SCX22240.1 Ben and cat operon transcriptional regulator [Agrobacterium sp. DSM 25558]